MGRFDVEPLNPLQALLQGQQGYEVGQKLQQKSALRDLLSGGGNGGTVDWGKAISATAASGDLDSAAKIAQIQKATSPDVSPSVAKYNFAVKNNGYKGSLLDFEKDIAQAGATRVNANPVINTGEKSYDQALNKDLADVFLGYQKTGRNAAVAKNTLDQLESLTNDPTFYSGAGAGALLRGKQALIALGVADPKSASATELFDSLASKALLDSAGGSLGAGISNSDTRVYNATVAGLDRTAEGNRALIATQRKMYGRQQEVAKMARDYAAKNGGRIDYKFDEQLADYAEKNPLFPSTASPSTTASSPNWEPVNGMNGVRIRLK